MTLILALASRSRVIQVSDRQLTRIHPITNARSSVPEPATKSVVFENRAVFGYTGLSILERSRADLWIADTISAVQDGNVMDAIELVRVGLERAFRPSMVPDPAPYQAVLVSGFRPLEEGSAFQAFNALVANSRNELSPTRSFAVEMFEVPPGQMALTQAPLWIEPGAFARLNRTIERGAERGVTFAGGTDLLVRAIRDVAAKHMEVGADLILASIPAPQNSDLGGVYMGRGRPVGDGVSFEYLSPTDGSFHFAPTMVMNGFIHRDVIEYHS